MSPEISTLKEYDQASLWPTNKSAVRHCKIIGTLGPASSDEKTIRELIEAGLNIVRLNFSHGDHETHLRNIETVRRVSREAGRQVAILQDLQGPKIRCGKLLGDAMQIKRGEKYALVYGHEQSDDAVIPVDYRDLKHDVKIGHRVLMDDGLLILEVVDIRDDVVEVQVIEGGTLKNRKGVNFPDSKLSLPAMTEKDSRDLLFGVANRVDFVALSFVQDPKDIVNLKEMIRALGADTPVVAKIEKLSAVERIDEIAQISDALMVARGDLGVEANVEKVPGYQKRIIRAATKHSKPVIIATQMLESMIQNPRPSLAEAADVANGVLDGADCLMLSGEVASGKYPVKCVEKMSGIIEQVEAWTSRHTNRFYDQKLESDSRDWMEHEAIALAACEAADAIGAKAIVCLTLTGNIAKTMARWRPATPIIALSPRRDIINRLSMVWGVYGIPNPLFYNTDVLLQDLPELLKEMKIVKSGEHVVITAGIPINQMSPTNMIKINTIP